MLFSIYSDIVFPFVCCSLHFCFSFRFFVVDVMQQNSKSVYNSLDVIFRGSIIGVAISLIYYVFPLRV